MRRDVRFIQMDLLFYYNSAIINTKYCLYTVLNYQNCCILLETVMTGMTFNASYDTHVLKLKK